MAFQTGAYYSIHDAGKRGLVWPIPRRIKRVVNGGTSSYPGHIRSYDSPPVLNQKTMWFVSWNRVFGYPLAKVVEITEPLIKAAQMIYGDAFNAIWLTPI